MHPPFYTVDHKIGPDITHGNSKPHVKRGLPARLPLHPATTGWPPLPLLPPHWQDHAPLISPSGNTVVLHARLRVVPQPSRRLRDVIGRWMIRTGQRMILPS